jgi:histidine triad (HIT) family protein
MAELNEEQLRQVSPEQIRELQKQNCLFCRITEGKVPARKVYEDEDCLAVLDINPANPGHMLLLPKEHYQIMPQIPEDLTGKLFMVSKALAQASLKSLKSRGTTIFAANGVAAGQRAPHFMMHIIPRMDDDSVGMIISEKRISNAELERLKKALEERMKKELGLKEAPLILDREPEKLEAEFD